MFSHKLKRIGLGLLAAGFFESVFFCGSLGIVFMVIGVVVFQKK